MTKVKETKAIKFKNFSTEDFTHSFDSVPYTFKAGQEMFLEDYKAEHFAKHLIDRELNRKNIVTSNTAERIKLHALCFPTDEAVTPLEALNIEESKKEGKDEEETASKKRGRPSKKVDEEEFSDLK